MITFSILGTVIPVLAGDIGRPENKGPLEFAQVLLRDKDYFGAIGEAKRFIYSHPGDPRIGQARRIIENALSQANNTARPSFDPWRFNSPPAASKPPSGPAVGFVRFYQNHLRTFRVSGCPSYPSCSEYTLEAMAKHGAVMGTFMFVDRLFREVSTAGTPPLVRQQGKILHYDPLSANDYWLKK